MYFQSIQLTHFRNYSAVTAEFNPRINCILGKNGAGKTNLLEAIQLLATTRCFAPEREVLKIGEAYFQVEGTLFFSNYERWEKKQIVCSYLLANRTKKILINRNPLNKISDHFGNIPIVVILPEHTEMVSGAPALRRDWIDQMLSMTSKIYLNQAIYLKKNVSQKNALLKRLVAYPSPSAVLLEELDPFDEFIATLSAAVVQTRRQFAADFFPILQKYHAFIIPTSETPNLIYHADYDSISATDWLKTLKEQRSKDIEKGYSNKGTHRDDLKFYIKGSPIKMIGSQGQRKTYLLALKFAEYEFVAQQTGKKPILLLDDIFEKLDEERLTRIAQLVSQDWSGQVFITDTNYTRIKNIFRYTNPELISYFSVENGELSKIE